MNTRITTAERGKYKQQIHAALYHNDNIKELLLGDTTGMSAKEIKTAFKAHVKSHLFIDDTVTDTGTFIYYDALVPSLHTNIKTCQVIMYLICHRSILEDYSKEGYYGDRIDILSQMVEEALIKDDKVAYKFGIGRISLDNITVYNAAKMYGCILLLEVPTFR